MSRFFDIETAMDAFSILEYKFKEYCRDTAKSAEDILLILMLANHLRERIAPNFNPKRGKWPPVRTPEQRFSKKIYEHPNFAAIRQLCNGSKHATRGTLRTDTKYERNMHAWTSFHKVTNMHKGLPISDLVDGEPIERIIEPVIERYRHWFSSTKRPKM